MKPGVMKTAMKDAVQGVNAQFLPDVIDTLDALPFYALLVDERHYIIAANKATHSQLGVKREDIIGKYCPQVVHGLDHPYHGCPLEEAAEQNRAIEREIYDEETGRWLVSSVYPTRAVTTDGRKVFLHMVIDVTDRKQAQENLKISHDQLRRLSAHLESVREEEKRKIARDLHDETSQLLASLYIHLEAAIETLSPEAKKTREILIKAQNFSTTILDEIHKLIYELRPSILDELGLIAAINSLINNHLNVAGLKVRFRITGKEIRLPSTIETVLFRVIQEAFNNIIKHAHASQVNMKLKFSKNSVAVQIQDNGIGFNVQEVIGINDRPRGLGLLGMMERVKLIDGSLDIKSSPGNGTQILIEVPLNGGVHNGQPGRTVIKS